MSPSRITSKMFRAEREPRRRHRVEGRVLERRAGRARRGRAGPPCPAGRRPRRGRSPVSGRAGGSCCSLNSEQEQSRERRRHRGVHLEPHHLGEPPIPHLLLDEAQQVVRLVAVLDLEVGVARDPERVPAEDLDPGEERLEIARRSPAPAARTCWASGAAPSAAGSSAPSPGRTVPRRPRRGGRPPARGSDWRCRGRDDPGRPPAA